MNPFGCGPNPCSWPCGPVTPPVPECEQIITKGCVDPPGDDNIYYLTVPAIPNINCTECSEFEGSFELVYKKDLTDPLREDVWLSPPSDSTACGHTPGEPLWKLYYNNDDERYYLQGRPANYRLDKVDWTCRGVNELLAYSAPVDQCEYPTELTVEACSAVNECGVCLPGTTTRLVSVTFSGWLDSLCTGCDALNATFMLEQTGDPCLWDWDGFFVCSPDVYPLYISYGFESVGVLGYVFRVFLRITTGGGPETATYLIEAPPPQDCSIQRTLPLYDQFINVCNPGDGEVIVEPQ